MRERKQEGFTILIGSDVVLGRSIRVDDFERCGERISEYKQVGSMHRRRKQSIVVKRDANKIDQTWLCG